MTYVKNIQGILWKFVIDDNACGLYKEGREFGNAVWLCVLSSTIDGCLKYINNFYQFEDGYYDIGDIEEL